MEQWMYTHILDNSPELEKTFNLSSTHIADWCSSEDGSEGAEEGKDCYANRWAKIQKKSTTMYIGT